MRANKRDGNEQEIVDALMDIKASVEYAYYKPYDLIVGFRNNTYLLEVKMPKGTLEDSQKKFQRQWRGHWAVVRNPDEALISIGALTPQPRI